MSKYYNLFKGFQKVFDASRSSSTPKNLRGNMSTTIVGVKPAKNLKKRFDTKQEIIKSIDEKAGNLVSNQKKSKIKKEASDKVSKIFDKYEKKAKGGRIGLKHGKYVMAEPNPHVDILKYETKSKIKDKDDDKRYRVEGSEMKVLKKKSKGMGLLGGPSPTKKNSSKPIIIDINDGVFKVVQSKAKGGRIGRKLGGGMDMGKRKTNVQKIKETFGPKKNLSAKQMKIAKLAGNPNKIDGADFKKLRGKA